MTKHFESGFRNPPLVAAVGGDLGEPGSARRAPQRVQPGHQVPVPPELLHHCRHAQRVRHLRVQQLACVRSVQAIIMKPCCNPKPCMQLPPPAVH